MVQLLRLGVRDGPKARQVPRAPLLAPGVPSYDAASCTPSEGMTPPSSLLRTHAPDQNPLTGFGCPSSGKSLQVAVSPCWELALPDVISASLLGHAWTHTPVGCSGARARFFPEPHRPSPRLDEIGFPTTTHTATSVWEKAFEAAVI